MTTTMTTKAILGMRITDRKLIERLEEKDAVLQPSPNRANLDVRFAGIRDGSQVQRKVVKRLEDRGYLAYRDGHYELSDAGRIAAQYARDLRAGRKK